MNRYLFRGFHKEENGKETIYIDGQPIKGKWVEGYYHKEVSTSITLQEYGIDEMENHYIHTVINHLPYKLKVIPETIGQYCGLEDKKGKKIFEKDVVKDIDEDEDYVVSFDEGAFGLLTESGKHNSFLHNWNVPDFLEVTGTKFDKEVNDNG